METKFYLCPTCGNIICKVVDSGVIPVCCGSNMVHLVPKTEDKGMDRHIPVIERKGPFAFRVKIGEIMHPSTEDHHIVFIALQLKDGVVIKKIKHSEGCVPMATFKCCKDEVIGVYAYCNVHGLWYTPFECK